MQKNEEEEHEVHVPTVNQSRDKERNLHFLEEDIGDVLRQVLISERSAIDHGKDHRETLNAQ